MIFNQEDKSDCIESIVRDVERTAVWRKGLAVNYKDNRNLRAAEILDKLAIDAAAMTDEQFVLLKDSFSWESMGWRNALGRATRQVGFYNRKKDFASFVRALIHELSLSSRVAA